MPSETTITKIKKNRETSIPLAKILSDYKYLGMEMKYYVFKTDKDKNGDRMDSEIHVVMAEFDAKKSKFIRVATVELSFISKDRYSVDFVYVHQNYRGKNLAAKLYRYLISVYEFTILSGCEQSPGGKAIWNALSKFKDIDIFISSTGYGNYRKTKTKFVNGHYPDYIAIDNVVFIATPQKHYKLVKYA